MGTVDLLAYGRWAVIPPTYFADAVTVASARPSP